MNTTSAHPCRPSHSTAAAQPSCIQYRQLKMSVRRKLADLFQDSLPVALVRRAVDEAELVALSTDFPHLFLPELAREQVERISASLSDRPFLAEPRLSAASAA